MGVLSGCCDVSGGRLFAFFACGLVLLWLLVMTGCSVSSHRAIHSCNRFKARKDSICTYFLPVVEA